MIVGGNAAFDKKTKTMTAKIYLVVKKKNVSAGWNAEDSVLSIAKHERTERILPAYKTKQQAKTYLKKFVETCDRKRYTIIELDLI